MSELGAYLTIAAYPLIGIFVFDWWNMGWGSEHHSFVLPPELKRKREEAGRPLLLVKSFILLLLLRIVDGGGLWHLANKPAQLQGLFISILCGIAGGGTMAIFRHFLSSLTPSAALSEMNEYFLNGSISMWLSIFVVGAFTEELWRALCILSFEQNGHAVLVANLLIAFAFSVAHQSGLPSRIAPGVASAGAEMTIGLMLGGLFIWSRNLIVPCFANLVYYIAIFFLARRDLRRPSVSQPAGKFDP